MSDRSDKHAKLFQLWQDRGRDPVIPVIPQYERASFGFCRSQVRRYAYQPKGEE